MLQRECTAEEAALQLGPYCGMVVITDGANGSCISAMGRLQVPLPSPYAYVLHVTTLPWLQLRLMFPRRKLPTSHLNLMDVAPSFLSSNQQQTTVAAASTASPERTRFDPARPKSSMPKPLLQVVPPFWASSKPVDTCGAGDGYAAGFMYGFLTGLDPASMGRFGSRVASTVITKHGGALSTSEAVSLVESLAMYTQESALKSAWSCS